MKRIMPKPLCKKTLFVLCYCRKVEDTYEEYINNPEARAEKAEKAYRIAVAEYNVDAFVQRINGLVEFLINEKKL